MVEEAFSFVANELQKEGITLFTNIARKHTRQGWMSEVFIVDSSAGMLVVHVSKLVEEHIRNKVWNKFLGLKSLLATHPQIPAPRIRYAGLHESSLVLLQDFIEGTPVGRRVLTDGSILDEWDADKKVVVPKVIEALTKVHAVQVQGFGWPGLQESTLIGPYVRFKEFFLAESPRWLASVAADAELVSFIHGVIEKVTYQGPAVLVHGDAINPGNSLLTKDGAISLLDWEWAIHADPAWEFCDLGWWSLLTSEYFSSDFIERATLYRPLWLLWGAHLHAQDKDPAVYDILRGLLNSTYGR